MGNNGDAVESVPTTINNGDAVERVPTKSVEERGVGKIARLPREFREVVNLMLQDGATQVKIIEYLDAKGFEGVRPQNLTNWYQNGFQKWLKQQSRLEEMKQKREFAMTIVRENEGSNINDAAMNIAASAIYEALDEFDAGALKALLAEAPENFAKVVNSLAKMSDSRVKLDRYREDVRKAREVMEQTLNRSKDGVLSKEDLASLQDQLKLL